jgi:hypothetical protein
MLEEEFFMAIYHQDCNSREREKDFVHRRGAEAAEKSKIIDGWNLLEK